MKIASSQVALHAASQSTLTVSHQQSLLIGNRPTNSSQLPKGTLDITAQLRHLNSVAAQQAKAQKSQSSESTQSVNLELSDKDKQKLAMLERMIEMMTGKRIKLMIPEKLTLDQNAPQRLQLQTFNGASFSLRYDAVQTVTESQSMQFNAQGVVRTADGRTIDFAVQMNLSRTFVQTNELHLQIGTQKDPLILNFNGLPDLGQRNFRFDLDNDGAADQIAFVGQGSGMLALDKNGNGDIDNGSELFGATSGDGFAELAAYDGDGNGWIDENDAIFDKLRIWTVDENGQRRLLALGQKGVGAIYLGNVRADYDLRDTANASLGTIRATGVFLGEDGSVGTVQHVDLTV